MAKTLFCVLAAALIVAAFAYEMEDNTALDVEFLKRDPEMQNYFLTEKRGMNMKKYKYCQQFNQDCWCSKRGGNIIFCNGAADGSSI